MTPPCISDSSTHSLKKARAGSGSQCSPGALCLYCQWAGGPSEITALVLVRASSCFFYESMRCLPVEAFLP